MAESQRQTPRTRIEIATSRVAHLNSETPPAYGTEVSITVRSGNNLAPDGTTVNFTVNGRNYTSLSTLNGNAGTSLRIPQGDVAGADLLLQAESGGVVERRTLPIYQKRTPGDKWEIYSISLGGGRYEILVDMVDKDNAPAAGVLITVSQRGTGQQTVEYRTNQDGTVVLPDGSRPIIEVTTPGASVTYVFSAPGMTTRELTLDGPSKYPPPPPPPTLLDDELKQISGRWAFIGPICFIWYGMQLGFQKNRERKADQRSAALRREGGAT